MRSSPSWRPATTILGATCGRPRAKISCAKSTPPDARSPLALPNATLFPIHHTRAKGGTPMKTSQDRILTTHVGSLPRPPELRQLLVRKDQAEPYDKAELDRLTRQAVVDIVRRQAEAGVDIVNDGEMSKPGYSTYIADRLSGFSGHEPAKPRLDT